jgi:hypothetical protein
MAAVTSAPGSSRSRAGQLGQVAAVDSERADLADPALIDSETVDPWN